MYSVADKIMKRISDNANEHWVCTPTDFLDIGSRNSIDKALSRLVGAGKLRRVGHGLYDKPTMSVLMRSIAATDFYSAIDAYCRKNGIRIIEDGPIAANLVGLFDGVAAHATYVTDGPSRTVRIVGRNVRFRHAGPRIMCWAGRPSALVVQALLWIGPDGMDDTVVSALKRDLPLRVKRDLLENCRDLPDWLQPFANAIANN